MGNIFLDQSSEFFRPLCQSGNRIFHDYCARIIRREGGSYEWIKIPRHKCNNPKCGRIHRMLPDYEGILKEAIQLRREVPRRSVEQIIWILESEERIAPGVLKRSTLQRHLYQAGFGSNHMDIYREARKSSSKRFCKPHRMMLICGGWS